MPTLDGTVRRSMKAFLEYIRSKEWTGRENEAISLYAFGFLQRECRKRGLLNDSTQIAIEVGAADLPKKSPHSQIRKDLVIWRQPGSNRWYPAGQRSEPLAIMEWKVCRSGFRSGSSNEADVNWLRNHCKHHPMTVGYAIWLDLRRPPAQLCVTRIDCEGVRQLAC